MTPVLREQLIALPVDRRTQALLDYLEAGSADSIDLQHVDLANARLSRVRLVGADLRHANLANASLSQADLSSATLEEANLSEADLAGAVLIDSRLGSANLRGALLDETDLTRASLRFAHLENSFLERANLAGADLWGAHLANAAGTRANLRDAILNEADLCGADFTRADLRCVTFENTRCEGANFGEANLQGSTLHAVRLRDARLQGTQLQNLDLRSCDLTHVWLSDASLEKTRLHEEQLGGAVGEELARDYYEAQRAYLVLERNFADLGEPDAASWAYRRKRRMQKLAARRRGAYMLYVADQLVEWVCDYGESFGRVMICMLMVYLLFAVVYGLTGSVVRIEQTPGGTRVAQTQNVVDLLVFSLLAMTTSGSPAAGLQPRGVSVQLLTGLQALLGIFLTGLMGFVVGHRIRR